MIWLAAILACVIVLYLGMMLGLYSICLENPRLHRAKGYVGYVPLFTFLVILYGLFSKEARERKIFRHFLRLPYKSMITLQFFAEVVAKEKEKHPKGAPSKKLVLTNVLHGVRQNQTAAVLSTFSGM